MQGVKAGYAPFSCSFKHLSRNQACDPKPRSGQIKRTCQGVHHFVDVALSAAFTQNPERAGSRGLVQKEKTCLRLPRSWLIHIILSASFVRSHKLNVWRRFQYAPSRSISHQWGSCWSRKCPTPLRSFRFISISVQTWFECTTPTLQSDSEGVTSTTVELSAFLPQASNPTHTLCSAYVYLVGKEFNQKPQSDV